MFKKYTNVVYNGKNNVGEFEGAKLFFLEFSNASECIANSVKPNLVSWLVLSQFSPVIGWIVTYN